MDKAIENLLETSAAHAMKDSFCLHEWMGTSYGFRICKVCECELTEKAYNRYKELENHAN